MADLTSLSITEASQWLRERRTTSVELTEATLARIAQTEPVVHAYVQVLADRARRVAYTADREIAQGRWRGVLHGIPLAIKDICAMRELPNEAGSRAFAGTIAGYDSTVVRRLEDAGAVIVGKTVTHEVAYGVNVPPTHSPWCLNCYPGGSSAGSGVSVAIGSAFGAIGTDTGGSIRIPAAINGIVGLKPTYGRVSRYGVVPLGTSLDHIGPMTRTVADNAAMLRAIAGRDAGDAGSIAEPVADYLGELTQDVAGLRIGIERRYYFYEGVAADVRAAVERVIATLQSLGVTMVDVSLPELDWSPEVLMSILGPESSTVHRRFLRERGADYDPATRRALEMGEFIPATHYLLAQRARNLLRHRMANLFRAHNLDALISPTMPLTTVEQAKLYAPREDYPGESPALSMVHQSFSANLTGQPALAAPCGLASNGLPVGYQLTGRPFGEATIFRLAHAYEQAQPKARVSPPEVYG